MRRIGRFGRNRSGLFQRMPAAAKRFFKQIRPRSVVSDIQAGAVKAAKVCGKAISSGRKAQSWEPTWCLAIPA